MMGHLTIALLDVDEDIFSTIIRCDKTDALVFHELLDCAGRRHSLTFWGSLWQELGGRGAAKRPPELELLALL